MRVGSALRQQWYRNMAVSIARRPAANVPFLLLTFLTVLINRHSVADVPAGASTPEELPHRRFEYKYSFKGPHLSQSDGSVPFWIHTGSKFVPSCEHHKTTTTHYYTAVFQTRHRNLEHAYFLFFCNRHCFRSSSWDITALCFAHSTISETSAPSLVFCVPRYSDIFYKHSDGSAASVGEGWVLNFPLSNWAFGTLHHSPGCPDKGSISTTRDYSIHDNVSDGTPLMNKAYKLHRDL